MASPMPPASAGLTMLRQRVLSLRLAAYSITTVGAALTAGLTRSEPLAILAGLAALVLAGSVVFRGAFARHPEVLLLIDSVGAGALWWIFGPVAAVDFVLFYVVAAAALLLPRRRAIQITAALLTVTAGQVLLHLPGVTERLPMFHDHGATGSSWAPEIVLRAVLVAGTAALFVVIAAQIRNAQEQTAAGERRFRDLVEASPDAIIVHDGGEVVFANQAAAELVRAESIETLTGRNIDEFVDPDAWADEERTARGARPAERHEARLNRLDGTAVFVESVAITIQFEGRQCRQVVLRDISERRRAELALRESEERYKTFFEGIPTALYRTTPDGRIVDANQALVDLLGYPDRESLLDLSVYDAYVRPHERTQSQVVLHQDGKHVDFEEELYRHDGARIWVRDSARIVRDDDGAVLFYEGTLTDVTQQKRAEEALRESEDRFRSAFQHAPVGMALVGIDGTLLRANDVLSEMLGIPTQDLLGRSVPELTHPEDLERELALNERLLAGEIPSYQVESRLFHADGGIVWVNLSATLVRDAAGVPLYGVGQLEDISDRKRAEDATRRLTSILEATPDFVVIADHTGRLVYANRAARDFYQPGTEAEASSLTVRDVLGIEGVEATLEEILQSEVWKGVLTLKRADGSTAPASTVIVNHRGHDGRIERFSAIARDMSENIRNQERLERLVRSKDEFVASVSHELRTPLTAVVGLAQELRDGWERFSLDETAEFISLIADQSTEVANIVEDLLVAARADIGKVSIVARTVDITEEADTVMAALGSDRTRTITVRATEPARAWADASRVRQIIRNLVTNAIRYGGDAVDLSVAQRNGSILVTVSDDGPGIPKERRETIFQPYERAHSESSQPASVGLGLTVSRQLARLMGGDLTYRYAKGRSCFELALPAAADPRS